MCENAEGYRVKCDMPGLSREEILLECSSGRLLLQGEAKLCLPAGMKVHAMEFCSIVYRLALSLPSDVDEKNLSAAYRDGVLVLDLPKKKQTLGRRIVVEALE